MAVGFPRVGVDFRRNMSVPLVSRVPLLHICYLQYCGGLGQLIGMRVQVFLPLSWVLRSFILYVAVMALFGGTEETLVTVNLGSLYRCLCR